VELEIEIEIGFSRTQARNILLGRKWGQAFDSAIFGKDYVRDNHKSTKALARIRN
jgi:hypothetical protein